MFSSYKIYSSKGEDITGLPVKERDKVSIEYEYLPGNKADFMKVFSYFRKPCSCTSPIVVDKGGKCIIKVPFSIGNFPYHLRRKEIWVLSKNFTVVMKDGGNYLLEFSLKVNRK